MSSSRGYSSKKVDPLNKRIPVNPRYAHIKHTVDTGASVSKYLKHLEDVKQNYRYRKDEIFRRIKATTFVQLILQVEQYNNLDDDDDDDDGGGGGEEGREDASPEDPIATETYLDPPESYTPPDTARSTLSGVISGMGEVDMKHQTMSVLQPPPPPSAPCPYLLLDVRDKDDYEQAHIITAKNYPSAMLSRSCNYFTKDILEYRNTPGRIIIIYDENERLAPQVATTFIQREVDNIFMLSGGMKVLQMHFPDCMITGCLPSSCLPTPPNSSRGNPRNRTSTSFSSSKTQVIPLVGNVKHRENFTKEDIDKIEDCLDNALLLSVGSRANSRSTTSNSQRSMASSVASSRLSIRTTSSTPWK